MITHPVRRALLAAAALLGPSVALAQSAADSDALSAVLACADTEREILRLECYDEAVAALRGRAESTRGASSTGRASSGAPAPDATIEVEGGARSSSAARAANDDRDAGDDEDRDRQVTVVTVRTAIPGRAVFVTADGEEFVQTSGRLRLYLPEVPFVANVRSGAVGGMFLTPESTRRSIRISERD